MVRFGSCIPGGSPAGQCCILLMASSGDTQCPPPLVGDVILILWSRCCLILLLYSYPSLPLLLINNLRRDTSRPCQHLAPHQKFSLRFFYPLMSFAQRPSSWRQPLCHLCFSTGGIRQEQVLPSLPVQSNAALLANTPPSRFDLGSSPSRVDSQMSHSQQDSGRLISFRILRSFSSSQKPPLSQARSRGS